MQLSGTGIFFAPFSIVSQQYRTWVRGDAPCSATFLAYPLDLAEARLHFCCTVRSVIQGFVGKQNILEAIFLTALVLSETNPKNESKHTIQMFFCRKAPVVQYFNNRMLHDRFVLWRVD